MRSDVDFIVKLIGVLLLAAVLLPPAGAAQQVDASPQATPAVSAGDARYEEAKRRLERERELAELEAKIAEARKNKLDAEPKAKATPNSGDLTISGEDIGYDIIVYRELGHVIARIANRLRQTVPAPSTIAIFDRDALSDRTFYRRSLPIFKIVIHDLTADYCLIATKTEPDVKILGGTGSVATSLASTANLVGQFADVLSYFRTQTTMTGKSVNIPEDALVASLFAEMRRDPNYLLLYPKVFPLESPVYCGRKTLPGACCQSAECQESREVYCSEIANLLDDLYRARRAAFTSKNGAPELKKLEMYFADFLRLLSEATPASPETALNKYLGAEQLELLSKKPDTYYLDIKSVRAVGTQRVRKNLFFLTDKLDYSGGVVISWTLFDPSGKVLDSGIETSYDGFIAPKDLRKRL